ncbi:hypothetical protein F5Y14DRAFT_401293 [Nemania sp. NC0429]|nr:hypothetical protein F5Y14DRAFT_401293 [Nemania sp. NC0429]
MACTTLDEGKEEDATVNNLRCVVIGMEGELWGCYDDAKYHTLIIRPVNNGVEGDVYERVGVASLKPGYVATEERWITIC